MQRFLITFIILLVLILGNSAIAQDKIHLHNGMVYEGTVLTIEPELVTISQGENKPTRSILKSQIKVIVYSDGNVDTFEGYIERATIQPILYHPAVVKNPRTAVLWSLLGGAIPVQGLGQFYNGQSGKGYGFLGVGLLSSGIAISAWIIDDTVKRDALTAYVVVLYFTSLTVSTYDAYQSANTINRKQLSISPANVGNALGIELAYKF